MQLYSQPPQRSFSQIVIPDDAPVYRIKEGKFFADDILYEPGSIIVWPEEPNMEMEPLNSLAREEMKKYVQKLDKYGRETAEKAGKAYVSLARAFENAAHLANLEGKNRRVELLNGVEEKPVLGARRRGPAKSKRIDTEVQGEVIIESPSANSARAANDAMGSKL